MALLGQAAALRDGPGGRRPRTRRRGEAVTGLAFVAPALAVFGVFMVAPLAMTGYYSLTEHSGFGDPEPVGLANFAGIAGDALFWRALANTAVFAAVTVPLSLLGGLGLALLLNRAVPARALLRALFYVPVVVSAAASGIVARWIFNESAGVANRLLSDVGLPEVGWQTSGPAAMASIIIVSVWANLGFVMVVYLAGLQGVPAEVHEASALDGAGRWRTIRSITVPILAPTTFFLLVHLVISTFQVFDLVVVMTGGGPANATTLLVNYAYAEGFQQRRQGYAAALGVVLYAIVLALTLVQWRAGRRRDLA
ncbi:MAG: ABC transporter, permease protein 1 (cluster 1, maltose/g3p/polyamine/iron) [uncultured Quadrisphaera sp.]|uniref:ABC transporter, permease protein 1 (Cluster 1, maltose/g3p/polyamine/iron) n=1 Tax=uncultured Quadrisphaera sp. TaxID=904978 RepID=A0A6J4NTT8_9ACTN|nr:MAG: ABC transporter, permease protein 1 (cluster 1, maltose/g3p/polyamine/iron) [uncultured Quadrisphaera sp.]